MNTDISIIVPCRDEDPSLGKKIEPVIETLSRMKYTHEMILSCDSTDNRIKNDIINMRKSNPCIKYVFYAHKKNREDLLLGGLNMASGKYIGFLHHDFSMPDIYIIAAILDLEKGFDAVIVRRHHSVTDTPLALMRHLASEMINTAYSAWFRLPRFDYFSPYKFFRRECILSLANGAKEMAGLSDAHLVARLCKGQYKMKEIAGLFLPGHKKGSGAGKASSLSDNNY
ncbi:MAG: glycosyltransferase [Bacteroidetes bacterium]|nr:glycosyltransferase [Bacteroidota bacterium]